MELDYYLFKTKITQIEFSKKVGVAAHTISLLAAKKHTPSLFTALKIVLATGGKVSLFDLLTKEQQQYLAKNFDFVKKDSLLKNREDI